MPFTLRPSRRFPVQCAVTYNAGTFQGQGSVWNLSCNGWRLSGDLAMRPEETLSLTVTLPNEQRIEVPQAVVRWSSGQEFAVENVVIEPRTHARRSPAGERCIEAGLNRAGDCKPAYSQVPMKRYHLNEIEKWTYLHTEDREDAALGSTASRATSTRGGRNHASDVQHESMHKTAWNVRA